MARRRARVNHWFLDVKRADAFDAAALTWARTLAFLNTVLRRT
jgi:hypothetical protein